MHHFFAFFYSRLSLERFIKMSAFFFIIGGLLLISSGSAQSEEKKVIKTVTVIGSAPYDMNNLAGTKKAAAANALSAGVNQVAASLVSSKALYANFKKYISSIAEKTDTFVDQYNLLAESSTKNRYFVILKVNVASGRLKSKLNEFSSIAEKGKGSSAKVLVLISEQNLDQQVPQFWWGEDTTPIETYSETGMMQKMKEAGIQVIKHGFYSPKVPVQAAIIFQPDLSNRDAIDIGKLMKADVVIVGKAVVYEVSGGGKTGKHTCNATLTARAVQVSTGNEIGSVFETVVKDDADASKGSRYALKMSGMNAAAKLLPKISAAPTEPADSSKGVSLMVTGTNNLGNFIRFRRALRSVDGVSDIQVQTVQADKAAVHVKTDRNVKELTTDLKAMQFQLFSVKINEVGSDSVKMSLIAK